MKKKNKTPQSASHSKPPMKRSRASVILGLLSAFFLALTGFFIFLFWDYIREPELLRDAIGEHYLFGALVLVFISAVQVVVALVPGEFVEIAAGYMFGSIGGSLLCLAGIVLGSCVTILLVRRFGRKFVYAFYPKEKLDNLPILNHPRKRNLLTFIIFFIPGTPKDLFTYAIGLTDMSIPFYILLTTVARFPSIISSTLTGNAAGTQNYLMAIIFLAVTAVLSGIGLLIYRRISNEKKKAADGSDDKPTAEDTTDP